MPPFAPYEHLVRLATLFVVGIALFLGVRSLLVPADYGLLGPYRASALAQNRTKPIAFAGQLACVDCHTDVAGLRKGNAHERISCESCHGSLAAHAADPAVAAPRPGGRTVCAICHVPDRAKPAGFKTVDFVEHAGDEPCVSCHVPHAPRL